MLMPSAESGGGCIAWVAVLRNISIPHYSISISLNVLLTLMIVTRLVLHGRDIRTSMGIAGIGGLCRAVITMLIESCDLCYEFAFGSCAVEYCSG